MRDELGTLQKHVQEKEESVRGEEIVNLCMSPRKFV
jgi:hypothetical protein